MASAHEMYRQHVYSLLAAPGVIQALKMQTRWVCRAYMNLAELFAHQGDLQQARFFYQKGLSVAQQHHWREGEAAASLNLGQLLRE